MPPYVRYSGVVILGIHSNVAGDQHELTAGHAWISVSTLTKTDFYGLWPDSHPRTVNNGDASDVRVNLEVGARPVASRYYRLRADKTMRLNALINKPAIWRYTNNCSSWSSELLQDVVGEDIDADDWLGLETPRELGASILRLEAKHKTSPRNPAVLSPVANASSF